MSFSAVITTPTIPQKVRFLSMNPRAMAGGFRAKERIAVGYRKLFLRKVTVVQRRLMRERKVSGDKETTVLMLIVPALYWMGTGLGVETTRLERYRAVRTEQRTTVLAVFLVGKRGAIATI